MRRIYSGVIAVLLVSIAAGAVRADDAAVNAVLDKAIKALGGEAKLTKLDAFSTKIKGAFSFNGNDNPFTAGSTVQGLDHYRSEFEAEFNGNKFQAVVVVNGDKGWRKFGDNSMDLDADALANEKRTIYLQNIPVTIVPLKSKGFKVESAADEKVADKPVAVLKVTGPDGKDFTLAFDKETGLPARVVAKVRGFQGEEFTQEVTFSDYADFDGIKRAKKTESKRDGATFAKTEVVEFKAISKVDPKTFEKPE